MAGILFVLVRQPGQSGWGLVAAAVDAADAQTAVDAALARHPETRVVVAQGVRSFTAAVTRAQDAVLTVEP